MYLWFSQTLVQREREAGRETDKQRGREGDRQTGREAGRQTEREAAGSRQAGTQRSRKAGRHRGVPIFFLRIISACFCLGQHKGNNIPIQFTSFQNGNVKNMAAIGTNVPHSCPSFG